MGEFVKVARLSEIPDQSMVAVEVRRTRIALFNLSGEIFAIADTCTHAEASLLEGSISGKEIVGPLHYATFHIKTGLCTGPPADEDVRSYTVRVSGDDVEIEIRAAGAPRHPLRANDDETLHIALESQGDKESLSWPGNPRIAPNRPRPAG